jgi:hypothetical protein
MSTVISKYLQNKAHRPFVAGLVSLALSLGLAATAHAAATITIFNNDPVGVGFNDTTVVAPVGGNTGTTLGQQRLIAFQAAAAKWGATLDSSVTITVRAQWTALTCTSTSAVLGSAGAVTIHRDFVGAPFASTWYSASLANKLNATDLDAANPEINANFNRNLGNTGCLDGTPFYLGLDNNHGTAINLVTVLIHEFGHGLGFQTFTSGTTGATNSGFPTIYDRFLIDLSSGKSWLQMTNAERAASALNARRLAWDGPQVLADAPSVLGLGTPLMTVNSPAILAGNYEVGTASFGALLTAGGITGNVVQAIDPADGSGPSATDGCSPLTNAAAVAGNIALIDRGTCGFAVKAKNAQDAGAIAVIIADNAAGSPPAGLGGADPTVVIPAVRVTLDDGNAIKAQLGVGVNVTLKLDNTVRAGADPFGKPLMFSPNPFQSGSSVSHWDTSAFPNQLMEPSINTDLTHEVTPPNDLTYSQMRDIGWVASTLPDTITKTTGDVQNASQNQPFATPLSVTATPGSGGITVTWTANAGPSGALATFAGTGTRFAVSTTNASGVAVAPTLTANGQSGAFSLNATVPGAGTTTFSLTNAPASLLGAACVTDTTFADFQGGVATNTDVTSSPGDVTLLDPPLVDQQNLTVTNSGFAVNATSWVAQTFQPAVTGRLARVDVNLFCSSCTGTTPNLTVSIRATSGDLPTGADLATATITGFNSGAGGLFTANFATPPTLTAGTRYAIVVRPVSNPSAGTYAYVTSDAAGPDVYPNGRRTTSTNSGGTWTGDSTRDLGFVAYMRTGYAAAGDFVSSLKDANAPAASVTLWSTLAWNATVPANTTLRYQVAASNNFSGPFNFVGPDGTAATYFTNGASLAQFDGLRYLRSKAYFTTSDATVTPVLNDVTVCYDNVALPDLTVSKSHSGNFAQGQVGAMYTVTVNNVGAGSKLASNLVTVTDTPPSGLTVLAMSGSGWSCAGVSCTRSDALAAGASYPPITVIVSVAGNATSPQVNSVAVTTTATEVSTANNTGTDSTTIIAGTPGSLSVSKFGTGAGIVTSLDAGISCGPTCTQTYSNGSIIELTASPGGGSAFTGWLGACTGNAPTCTVGINGAVSVSATFAQAPVATRILDVDANNAYDAATDGVVILRHLFGLTGSALTANALGAGFSPPRVADPALHNYLVDVQPYLDVDGNGQVDALTDGLMILRKLLGLSGSQVTQSAIGVGATRNAAAIDAYIMTLMP